MNEQSGNNDLGKKFKDFSYPVGDESWEAISAHIPSGIGGGFLSEKFAVHTVTPSSGVWKGIAAVINPKSRKRPAAWWWYGAAASLLLFAYLASVTFNEVENQTYVARDQSKSEVNTGADTTSENTKQSEENLASEKSNQSLTPASAEANTAILRTGETDYKFDNETAKSGNSFAEKAAQTSQTDEFIADEKSGMTNSEEKLAKTSLVEERIIRDKMSIDKISSISKAMLERMVFAELAGQMRTLELEIATADESKKKESRFYDGTEPSSTNKFTVLAGSQLAFAGGSEQEDAALNSVGVNTGNFTGSSSDLVLPASVNYSTPVYYGVNGEIIFWKRFSAGLGLGYLNMKTTSDYYFPSQERIAEETENRYLSIPVYLKFNFINKPKFTAYTTVGNALDIMIWQKTTADTYVNGQLRVTNGTSKRQKGNQANVYAGLGMSFKFTQHLGVFAEGSAMRYYHSSTTNFYSQKNVWPGLKFGLLVTF